MQVIRFVEARLCEVGKALEKCRINIMIVQQSRG